ncbi:MAG: Uma2 family endonuclease [Chloroflexi bacterium]|nr:Uma2 family endonuclease [Chloroflexota bacterium]
MTSVAERLLTAEEFMALPDDPSGGKMELVDGKVVTMPPAGARHGYLARRLDRALSAFIDEHGLGILLGEAAFLLARGPDVVRAPDSAVVNADRVPFGGLPDDPFDGPPSLAIEVLSPNDRRTEWLQKVGQYLDAGAPRVWVVDPRRETVTVYDADRVRTLTGDDTLTSDDAGFTAPGFELKLRDLFA